MLPSPFQKAFSSSSGSDIIFHPITLIRKDVEDMLKLFVNYIVYYVLNLLHPILVPIAVKILSWEPPKQKPNPVRAKVSKKLAVPDTIQETAPPIKLSDMKPSLDYKQILKERAEAGKPIKPVKNRKPK